MAKIALACTILPDSPPARLIEWSRAAEDAGFSGVFMTEANNDSLACSLALGLHTKRIKLGTAITNIYLRHPNLLANEAAAVQEFTGGRFILGLGTGHREGNSALGIEMGVPLTKMRETVKTLRAALDGGKTGPRVSAKLPLYLAGVSRPMVKLAGEIGDGVIFNFFPPARVKEALGELAEGAKIAGRDPKADRGDTVRDRIYFRRPRSRAPSRAQAAVALRRAEVLRQHDGAFGLRAEIGAIRAAGRDADAAIKAVSDELIDTTLLVGSESRVRERLQELCAPGIGTAIVFTNPVNEDRNAAVMRTIRALKQ